MHLPDSNFYDQAWKQARQNASLYHREKDPAAWQVFWDHYAPTYLKICRALLPANRKMVHKWKEEGLLHHQSRVLDIGCGPGTYTLPLGEVAGEVVGLDTAANMLRILGEEAQRQSLDNIHLLQGDWRELPVSKKYDLVFAANSPAIGSLETLLKMNEASRGGCMLVCYAEKMTSSLRHLLWERIMGEKMQGNTFDISYPFNILYREGYYPHLKFQEQQYSYAEDINTVLDNYRAYFKIFGKAGPAVDRILEKCVQEKSVDGCLAEKVSYRLAVMSWSVNA